MELGAIDPNPAKAKYYINYDSYYHRRDNVSLANDVYELADFRSQNMFVVTAPRADHNSVWDYRLVGHYVRRKKYHLISEVGKTATLSLLRAVEANFSSGHCFSPFDSSNVVLTNSGQVLLKNVSIIDPSYGARRSNLENAVAVVRDFLGGDVPDDVNHLLQMMDDKVNPILYTIHASLIPHTNKSWVFIQLYELVKRKIGATEKDKILLKIPYHDEWRVKVHLNSVLTETYDYSEGSYDRSTKVKTDVEERKESAELFLDFLRNGLSHCSQRTLITVCWQFDMILLVLFPLLLPRLQEAFLQELGDSGAKILQAICKPMM